MAILCLLAMPHASAVARAQPASVGAASTSAGGRGALTRAYLNCLASACAVVVPTEDIDFVQWVRNLADAEVSVLVTQQPNGGGGQEVTIVAADANGKAAHADTLVFAILPGTSAAVMRTDVARWIRLALVRAVASHHGDAIDVRSVARVLPNSQGDASARTDAPAKPDRWHRWTVTSAGSALLEDEQQFSARSGSLGAVASRITTNWRINLGGGLSSTATRNTLSDGSVYRTTSGSYNFGTLVVKSVKEHWAVGALSSTTHSDFLNEQSVVRVAAAGEYDFFPYSVATHRAFTVRYQAGVNRYRFEDTTLFGKIEEVRPSHSVVLAYGTQSVWGSIDSDLTYSSFIQSPSFNAALLEVSANLTVAKGLALNVTATAGRVHDQIYIRRAALTDNEILAKQKALFTTYSSSLSVGLTYTFGSILSNIVNARFSGTGVTASGRVPTSGF